MFQKIACIAALIAFVTGPAFGQQPEQVQQNPAELEYSKQVVSLLSKQRRYPPAAKSEKLEGIAVVFFQLAPDGRVISRRIVQSSGHDILDQAALEVIDRSNPFPAVPEEIRKNWNGTYTVPVYFRLTPTKKED